MTEYTALLVDDLAADRNLAARVLRQAGWTVFTARTTVEAQQMLPQLVTAPGTVLIITDLHMPADPLSQTGGRAGSAGSQFVLGLRAQMERGELARLPLVALTALTEREILLTALAFGCDTVITKPVRLDLAARIIEALTHQSAVDSEPVGTHALLGLLRRHLAEAAPAQPATQPALTEHDITRALLAYHRQGMVGLGQSTLAVTLAPDVSSVVQRGEWVYAQLLAALTTVMELGAHESIQLLMGELRHQLPPAEQSRALGLSTSEYYRRRRDAVAVLLDMLLRQRES